jgi:MoxR-like ATPase
VRQVAAHFNVPLVDLRLTTIEPVDIRGAIYVDDVRGKTVWFPPEFLPDQAQPEGLLFLDELTAADQRLQVSAYSLILDRSVGNYRLPQGWLIVAAGNATYHGAISHDMSAALADRMFHFNVNPSIEAFLEYALTMFFAPEVMAYLRVRPDKLDDSEHQTVGEHLIGTSPRGWEDVSNVMKSNLSENAKRTFVEGRIGAANAAEFFAVLKNVRAGADVVRLLAARPGTETAALLPATLDALYGLIYALQAACVDARTTTRVLEIIEEFSEMRGDMLPVREAQTLAVELIMQRALVAGLEAAVVDSPAYRRHVETRPQDHRYA